jgi:outer membrane protein
MNRILILTALICSSLASFAQQFPIDSLWASANSYEKLKQANTNLALARLNIKAEKLGRLPLIYAEGNLQRNLITATTPVPAIAFNPNASPGDILPLKFATDWNAKGGLQFSIDLFNPQTNLAIKTAELDKQSASLDLEKETRAWKKQATAAYAKVVLSSSQYVEALADSARYASIVSLIKERQQAGRATLIELNNAKQEQINKQTQLQEAYRVLQVANMELSNFADTRKYNTLSSSMQEIVSKLQQEPKNLELEQLLVEQKKLNIQLSNLKKEALPTLSLNAFYGSQYYSNSFNLWNNENWYGNSYVNLGIRIPISEAVNRALKKKQLSLQNQVLLSRYREEQSLDSTNSSVKQLNIFQAEQVLKNTRAIEALSAENLTLVQHQYQAGRVLLTVYNEELNSHFKKKQQVWQAEYDYLLAVLETM